MGKGRVGQLGTGDGLGWSCGMGALVSGVHGTLTSLSDSSPHPLCCQEGDAPVTSDWWCLRECGQGLVYRDQTLLLLVVLRLSCPGPVQLPGTPSSGHGALPSTFWTVFSFFNPIPSSFHQHFIFRKSSQFLIHQGTLS